MRSKLDSRLVCYVCALFSLFAALVVLSLLTATTTAYAQSSGDLVTITVQGTSKAESQSEASREITAWASANTAKEQIVDLLGEAKFQKNKVAIENKIIKQSSRFIPFVNPGEPTKARDGSWQMPVELKISIASLRKMVLEAGFLSDVDGPAAIVPMITFTDRTKGISLRWWLGEEKGESYQLLAQMSRSFYDRLQTDFIRQGFYMMKPLGSQTSPLPSALRSERPSQSELTAITDYLKMSMVARGDVRIMESKAVPNAFDVEVKVQVLQPETNRAIAEVSRQFTTEPGAMTAMVRAKTASEFPEISKDLSTQVLEAWQRGTLNANLVKLAVLGTLTPKQMNDFKSALLGQVTEVKSLKERMFDRGEITFEADVTGDAKSVAEKLKSVQFAGFQTRVTDASVKALTIEVKAR